MLPKSRYTLSRSNTRGAWLREPGVTRVEYQERFPQFSEQLQICLRPEWKCTACPDSKIQFVDERVETVTCPRCGKQFPVRLSPEDSLSPSVRHAGGKLPNTTWPKIPGYTVREELGRGGMGVVYKAWQSKQSRFVALKLIKAGLHASPKDLARFRSEVKSAGRLQHENIVTHYDARSHNGEVYCVLEYVSGGSLAAKLGGTPQPPREAAALVQTLAHAISVAHSQSVVHRDLKPSNVLLTPGGHPKISDFGLAKRLDVEADETDTGEVIGTPSYMAPEQTYGKFGNVSLSSDIYSLGAILYEMITGNPPFKGNTVQATIDQVRARNPIAPRLAQPGTPRDLETICLKCLRKEPKERTLPHRNWPTTLGGF